MAKLQLTPSVVSSSVCPAGQKRLDIFDTQSKGLVLEIRATGGKTYYLRYQNKRGKTRQLKLSDARDVTLAQARTLAAKARNKIAMGEDPAEAQSSLKQVPTFAEFVSDSYLPFIRTYKRSWRSDTGLLRNHLLPRFGTKHLDEICRQDIVRMMSERNAAGAAPSSVNHLLVLTRYIFNLACKWQVPG
ncbi:MAG: integrase arm-type DNA-binding domain-containing protein, partial [Betaproteobacteria bacterium]